MEIRFHIPQDEGKFKPSAIFFLLLFPLSLPAKIRSQKFTTCCYYCYCLRQKKQRHRIHHSSTGTEQNRRRQCNNNSSYNKNLSKGMHLMTVKFFFLARRPFQCPINTPSVLSHKKIKKNYTANQSNNVRMHRIFYRRNIFLLRNEWLKSVFSGDS